MIPSMNRHFETQDALAHVVEKKVEGILSLSESHGIEMPGHISAAADAARETAVVILLVWLLLQQLSVSQPLSLAILTAFGTGWLGWKCGRSAWLGWVRLERFHRLIEQEKYEIEHHRPQEREELVALYRSKGFEGKLLEDVVDVLMADQDRLLKVMLEEELGLTLEAQEHPLKQSLGAGIGTLSVLLLGLTLFSLFPNYGIWTTFLLSIGAATSFSARFERNAPIGAIIWNLGLGILAFGLVYFTFQILT